ncbi:MAG: CcmE/CycJ protein [Proteobacteria bacterium]|nr:CcmE/CycJ protein [Pseudomonadota bacterium]
MIRGEFWQNRPTLIVAAVFLLGALALILIVLNNSLAFYYTPTEVHAGKAPTDESFNLGGLVREGSLRREVDGLSLRFVLTDREKDIEVRYKGIPPDLFGEGRGAVVQGHLGEGGVFLATRVLAKHDENHLPPEHKK